MGLPVGHVRGNEQANCMTASAGTILFVTTLSFGSNEHFAGARELVMHAPIFSTNPSKVLRDDFPTLEEKSKGPSSFDRLRARSPVTRRKKFRLV